MDTEKYTVQVICDKLGLLKRNVQQMVREGQLKPLNPGKKPMYFSREEFERVKQEVRAKRLASLKQIARACEELGMYDDDFEYYKGR